MRPYAVTSSCPVYISSMCPFSLPVVDHCRTNCGCARLPILLTVNTETGTVTSAISASSGEIRNITKSTPTMVSTEVTTWLSVCCSDWARLSMSLVTRDRISPRGCASKYRSGSRASLACTSARIRNTSRCTIVVVTRPWNSAATDAAAYRASTMTSRRPSCVEVDALPGVQRQRLDQPGLVALALVLQPGDHLGLGRPGRESSGKPRR